MSVTQEQIDAWKAEHGKLNKLTFPQTVVIYKALTRADYNTVMQRQAMGMSIDPELETFKLCVLNDISDELLNSAGGIVSVTYEHIMIKSGFVTVESEEL